MITIHYKGHKQSHLVQQLVAAAGGDHTLIRSSGLGVTVPDEVAYRWLAASLNGSAPVIGSDVDTVRIIQPPDMVLVETFPPASQTGNDVTDAPPERRRPGRPRKNPQPQPQLAPPPLEETSHG